MKTLSCVFLIVATAVAEPPLYRAGRYMVAKQEIEKEPTTPRVEQTPYPAAGYNPPVEFKLPIRQEILPPATSYGVPDNSYSAPLNIYFVPTVEYGAPPVQVPPASEPEPPKQPEAKKDVEEVTKPAPVQAKTSAPKPEEKKEKLVEAPKSGDIVSAKGAYYVLLPGSQLQRVQFETENDVRNMAYTAHLQYRDEDRGPIYVYSAVQTASPAISAAQYGVPAPATQYGLPAPSTQYGGPANYIQVWK